MDHLHFNDRMAYRWVQPSPRSVFVRFAIAHTVAGVAIIRKTYTNRR